MSNQRNDLHQYLPEEKIGAVLHGQALGRKESRAAELMNAFVEDRQCCLALSFGKDSMTLLHIACKFGVLPKLGMVMWNNSGVETNDTIAMRDYVIDRYTLADKYVETCPTDERLEQSLAVADINAPHPVREFVYQCLEQPRWSAMDAHQINGTIIGLRAEESRARKISARMRGKNYFNKREQAEILTPISWWQTQDIFEYAARENIPLHPYYAKALRYGKDRHRIRVNTPVDISFANQGDMIILKREYPETYAKLGRYIPSILKL